MLHSFFLQLIQRKKNVISEFNILKNMLHMLH